MNIHWTEAAIADLHAIEAYISRHSQRYADAMVRRIIERTEALTEHQLLGSVVREYGNESLREILETPYRIIYQVSETQLDIIAVVHAARRMPPSVPSS